MPRPWTEQDKARSLAEFACAAIVAEKRYGVPAEVTVAQAVLETGWGKSRIGLHNVFGIKFVPTRHPGKVSKVLTVEYIGGQAKPMRCEFAEFSCLADAFADHGLLISGGATKTNLYAKNFRSFQQHNSIDKFVRGMAVHYATDPRYADKVLSIAKRDDVQDAIEKARAT